VIPLTDSCIGCDMVGSRSTLARTRRKLLLSRSHKVLRPNVARAGCRSPRGASDDRWNTRYSTSGRASGTHFFAALLWLRQLPGLL